MNNSNESRFIENLHKKDPLAIKELYNMVELQLYYHTRKFVEDKEQAKDIATDSFMKVIDKLKDFTSIIPLKAYLFKIAYNAAIDAYRKHKREETVLENLEHFPDTIEYLPDDAEVSQAEVIHAILQEIEKLPKRCREAFTLLNIKGVSITEAAELMQTTSRTVRNQKAKATMRLRIEIFKKYKNFILVILALTLIQLFGKHESIKKLDFFRNISLNRGQIEFLYVL